jgi:hypothetical protein
MTFGPSHRADPGRTVAVDPKGEETAMTVPPLEQHAINHLIARLVKRYAGRYDEATVRRTVEDLEREYLAASVHTFVPLLVERNAKRVLDAGLAR